MIESLGELNERFYELYGRLRENDELLTARQADFMADVLYDQYKQEYERLRLYSEINEKNDLYALQFRHAALIPKKRFLLFRNQAMKQADAELGEEIAEHFAERERAEEQREEQAEEADGADETGEETTAEEDGESG